MYKVDKLDEAIERKFKRESRQMLVLFLLWIAFIVYMLVC